MSSQLNHYQRALLNARRRWRSILTGRDAGTRQEREVLFNALRVALMRYDRKANLEALSEIDSMLHHAARAIIEGQAPWPKELLKWKTLCELRYYHGETDRPEPPWCDEDNMTPAQRRHIRDSEAAFDRWAAVIREPNLPGENEAQKDARAAAAGPWPYPEYQPRAGGVWRASRSAPKLAANESRRRKA